MDNRIKALKEKNNKLEARHAALNMVLAEYVAMDVLIQERCKCTLKELFDATMIAWERKQGVQNKTEK